MIENVVGGTFERTERHGQADVHGDIGFIFLAILLSSDLDIIKIEESTSELRGNNSEWLRMVEQIVLHILHLSSQKAALFVPGLVPKPQWIGSQTEPD